MSLQVDVVLRGIRRSWALPAQFDQCLACERFLGQRVDIEDAFVLEVCAQTILPRLVEQNG